MPTIFPEGEDIGVYLWLGPWVCKTWGLSSGCWALIFAETSTEVSLEIVTHNLWRCKEVFIFYVPAITRSNRYSVLTSILEGPTSPANFRRLGGGPSSVSSSSPESDVSSTWVCSPLTTWQELTLEGIWIFWAMVRLARGWMRSFEDSLCPGWSAFVARGVLLGVLSTLLPKGSMEAGASLLVSSSLKSWKYFSLLYISLYM